MAVLANNQKRVLLNFQDKILYKNEYTMLYIFIMLFVVFSFNIVPKDIMLLLIISIFSLSSMKNSLFMFLFFSVWENVAVFSFGITLNLVFQVIFSIKIIMNSIKGNYLNKYKYKYLDIIMLSVIVFYGIMNYVIGTGSLSGIGISLNVLIVIYASKLYMDEKNSYVFWKLAFYILMLSTIFAIIYGMVNKTSPDRWIRGIGYVPQIYGTIGTARIGMFICASLIYPVFYLKNKPTKIVLSVILSILALMTLSITTFICFLAFWTIVFVFKEKHTLERNIKIMLFFTLLIVAIILLWPQIKEISFIKPIMVRIEGTIESLLSGDMEGATSSRFTLAKVYMSDYKDLPLINKLIGSFYINRTSFTTTGHYSHNSFIDVLLYSGLFGIILFAIAIFKNVSYYRKRQEFLSVLLLKVTFVITGLSVSMLSSTYWFIWLIL